MGGSRHRDRAPRGGAAGTGLPPWLLSGLLLLPACGGAGLPEAPEAPTLPSTWAVTEQAAPAPTEVLGPPTAATRAPAAPGPPAVASVPPRPAPGTPAPGTPAPGTAPPVPTPSPTPSPPPRPVPSPSATPAPEWLGSRVLAPAGSGPVAPQDTPPELLDRRIVTTDVLPPPADSEFRAVVDAVPPDVLARSTWQPACPVAADDLRYVRVAFWGFDGLPHTGEVLVHADAVEAVVGAFRVMHAERFPLEEVRVIRAEELDAAPTGDGNTTSAFVCRPVTGGSRWSEHAYGRALDVNPFHNPYERGTGRDRVVIPELATAYTDRSRELPGMVLPGSAVVRAFADAGWGWGGDYRSSRDWMHFSASGR